MQMRPYFFAGWVAAMLVLSGSANAGDVACILPEFSEANVIEHVRRERSIRNDLPPEMENAKKEVTRKRCHYNYVEYGETPRAEKNRVFVISRYGSIVDAYSGRSSKSTMICPPIEFSKEQLASRLLQLRTLDSSIPPAPDKYTAKVSKMRCLFVYWEVPLPETPSTYSTFTFDYYGDLVEFYSSK